MYGIHRVAHLVRNSRVYDRYEPFLAYCEVEHHLLGDVHDLQKGVLREEVIDFPALNLNILENSLALNGKWHDQLKHLAFQGLFIQLKQIFERVYLIRMFREEVRKV